MPKKAKATIATPIEAIKHDERRANIPTEELRDFVARDEAAPPDMLYPRDPSLDPQLVWKGKDEQDREGLNVPVVPIYIQEKVHPQAIIDDFVRSARKAGTGIADDPAYYQTGFLFNDFNGLEDVSFDRKVDFYSHDDGSRPHWSNRMILGDSLLVMTSLAEKEGLKGQVQMIYIDPPYGIEFNSNWQVSTRNKTVTDGRLSDMSRQPEQIKAFRDTWKYGINSFLAYLRDRLTVAQDLLTETGSIFVQIGDANIHLVRCLLDEVFGDENFVGLITFRKKNMPFGARYIEGMVDYLLWYAKDFKNTKYRSLYAEKDVQGASRWNLVELADGHWRTMSSEEWNDHRLLSGQSKVFTHASLKPSGIFEGGFFSVRHQGRTYPPPTGGCWATTVEGMDRLIRANRVGVEKSNLRYRLYFDDYPVMQLHNFWTDTSGASDKIYAVQTMTKVVQRCLLMTTDPGDLVLDPTCGSGTTATVAEQWGRRWITVDTSRVALALARTRLMSAKYPYYHLAADFPDLPPGADDGAIKAHLKGASAGAGRGDIRKGFVYKRVPHITLKSIANNPEIDAIHDRWQPKLDALRAEINAAAGKQWEEWEIPRAGENEGGGAEVRELLVRWWDTRRTRQAEIDAAISRHADTEILYDQPYDDPKRLRVAGPFTVESLSPHRMLDASENDQAGPTADDARQQDFTSMILDYLRKTPVQSATKNERLKLENLRTAAGPHVHATAEYTDANDQARRVAVHIGPQYGTVSSDQLKAAAKDAVRGLGCDLLLVCGFAFDPSVNEEATRYGALTVLIVKMNPDLLMGDALLKKTGAGNLFMVFGEPDLRKEVDADGRITIELLGLDIFDPTTGDIRNSTPDDIACWFIDTDYNEEAFFVRHAYFTGADEPYEKLTRALKAEVDEAAWSALYSTRSRPFERPESGTIAVKVINHYGDEVMKVFSA